jgi:hypothetical protein
MKALHFPIILLLLMVAGIVNAQAPSKFNYQAVARDGSGIFLPNQAVRLQISIRQGSASGTIVYTESHAVTTTNIGLINVAIGTGVVSSGSFGAINWGAGPYFIEMGLDVNGGTNYTILGTQQFLSVPYAMFADSSANPGPAGPMGPVGPQGAQGQAGPTGPQGAPGQTGLTGPQGAQGQTGPAGPQGQQGVAGPTGPIGPTGLTGAVGSQGPQGPQGPIGIDGPTGPMGPAGPTGQTGATGQQGPIGQTGAMGPQGPAGPTGPTGQNGAPGQQGNTGPAGPTGPTGPSGSANINGTTDMVIKFTGPTTGGNSVIYSNPNPAALNVGIGTTGPSSNIKLVVYTPGLSHGIATTATNTGLIGIGNSGGTYYTLTGAGVAGTGSQYASYGYYTNTSGQRAGGAFSGSSGNTVFVSAYSTGGTSYKVWGSGTVSTIARDLIGNTVTLHCPEAPEILFQDFGRGELINGLAHVEIDPIFANNVIVDDGHPMRAIVQLEGECNGVFVTNKTPHGFDVKELNGGSSNAPFTWFVSCNRADEVSPDGTVISKNQDMRFEPGPLPIPLESDSPIEEKQQPSNSDLRK